jgi:hypothetical protein
MIRSPILKISPAPGRENCVLYQSSRQESNQSASLIHLNFKNTLLNGGLEVFPFPDPGKPRSSGIPRYNPALRLNIHQKE